MQLQVCTNAAIMYPQQATKPQFTWLLCFRILWLGHCNLHMYMYSTFDYIHMWMDIMPDQKSDINFGNFWPEIKLMSDDRLLT